MKLHGMQDCLRRVSQQYTILLQSDSMTFRHRLQIIAGAA